VVDFSKQQQHWLQCFLRLVSSNTDTVTGMLDTVTGMFASRVTVCDLWRSAAVKSEYCGSRLEWLGSWWSRTVGKWYEDLPDPVSCHFMACDFAVRPVQYIRLVRRTRYRWYDSNNSPPHNNNVVWIEITQNKFPCSLWNENFLLYGTHLLYFDQRGTHTSILNI
jgi:hypothetical protein